MARGRSTSCELWLRGVALSCELRLQAVVVFARAVWAVVAIAIAAWDVLWSRLRRDHFALLRLTRGEMRIHERVCASCAGHAELCEVECELCDECSTRCCVCARVQHVVLCECCVYEVRYVHDGCGTMPCCTYAASSARRSGEDTQFGNRRPPVNRTLVEGTGGRVDQVEE